MRFKFLLSTRKHMPLQAERLALKYGFDGIELVMQWEETPERVQQYRHLRHVHAIHAPITEFDCDRFEAALLRATDLAQQLGVTLVNIHPGALAQGGRSNVKQCYVIAREAVKKTHCVVAIEVLPKPEKERHLRERAYDNPWKWVEDLHKYRQVGTLDTTHLASWQHDPTEYLVHLGKRLVHLHVSDYQSSGNGKPGEQHLFIGEGEIKFKRFFRQLLSLPRPRQTMYVTLEQAGRYDLAEHEPALRKSLRRLRRYAQVEEVSRV